MTYCMLLPHPILLILYFLKFTRSKKPYWIFQIEDDIKFATSTVMKKYIQISITKVSTDCPLTRLLINHRKIVFMRQVQSNPLYEVLSTINYYEKSFLDKFGLVIQDGGRSVVFLGWFIRGQSNQL